MKKILFGFVMCGLLGGSLLVSAHEQQDKLATEKAEQQAAWSTADWAKLEVFAEHASYSLAFYGLMVGLEKLSTKAIVDRSASWFLLAVGSGLWIGRGINKYSAIADELQGKARIDSVQNKLAAQPICTQCVGLSAWQPSPQTAEHESCTQSRQAISDMMTDE